MTTGKKACTCPVQAQPSWAELHGDVSSDVTWANVFHLRLVDSRMHSADPEAHCVAWLSTRRAGLLAEMWLRVCSTASLFTTDHRRPSQSGPGTCLRVTETLSGSTLVLTPGHYLCFSSCYCAIQWHRQFLDTWPHKDPAQSPPLTSGWFVLENSVDLSLKMSVQWVYC